MDWTAGELLGIDISSTALGMIVPAIAEARPALSLVRD